MSRAFTGVAAVAAALTMHAAGGAAVVAESVACDVAAIQAKAPPGTTITAAAVVRAEAASRATARWTVMWPSPGNEVNFRLGLPERWNGKFYFFGVGGLGGTIGSLDTGLARGYASASTDTGHGATIRLGARNRAKEIDYGHRGTHVTAVAGKAMTASFYGRAPQHAYFEGCSNGGRQALMEVQRYPDDFDGIIAGDPATGTPMQAGRALVFQKLLASPESYLPTEKIEMVSRPPWPRATTADGLKDGLVSDPRDMRLQTRRR